MKYLILSLLMLILTTYANAQEDIINRKYVTGGNFSINVENNNSENGNSGNNNSELDSWSAGLNPYLAKYLNPDLIAGFSLNLGYSNRNHLSSTYLNGFYNLYENETSQYTIGLSVFLRKTVYRKNKFGFYISPSLGYKFIKSNTSSKGISGESEYEVNNNIISISLGTGVSYDISPRLRALIRVGNAYYSFDHEKRDSKTSDKHRFGISLRPDYLSYGVEYSF